MLPLVVAAGTSSQPLLTTANGAPAAPGKPRSPAQPQSPKPTTDMELLAKLEEANRYG
jgi:hypothetical protein